MTLVSLTLHNYMIHRDLSADFDGNLIALTGEMGHGKSTFVGAIQFCLTGEHPPWHREDLLSWGASEGSAKLEFMQDGISCSILRRLHTSDATLKIGEDTITGVKNVEKALSERLGVDKDILKQIGFVQQYEIQSILFDDPGKRERSFQKLLGIGDANKIWTELGPIIQGYSKTENFDASIEQIKQSIIRLDDDLKKIGDALDNSKKAMDLMPSRDDMMHEIDRLSKINSTAILLDTVRESLNSWSARLDAATQKKMTLETNRKTLLAGIDRPIDEMDKLVESLRVQHAADVEAINRLKKLSESAGNGTGTCPLCGSSVSADDMERHVKAEMDELEKNEKKSCRSYTDINSAYSDFKKAMSFVEAEIRKVDSEMSSATSIIDTSKEQEKTILRSFAELGISPDMCDAASIRADVAEKLEKAKETSSQYDSLNRQISVLQGEMNAKKQQLDEASEALQKKVKEKELNVPNAKRLETISNVRNWFHSSNGPRTMSLSAIKAMTGYVNEYLQALHSEIEVMPDNQGLSFAFSYVDGRPVSDPPPSTAKLSGGQKIELALAFRLAIYRYFGQKMGIMVLDEPTAHLSPSGIEYFGTLLQTVSALAKNMNLQIIMPTHEKEIMPYMDSEIHFD